MAGGNQTFSFLLGELSEIHRLPGKFVGTVAEELDAAVSHERVAYEALEVRIFVFVVLGVVSAPASARVASGYVVPALHKHRWRESRLIYIPVP